MSLKRIDQVILDLHPHWTRSKVQSLIEKNKVKIIKEDGSLTLVNKPGRKVEASGLAASSFEIEDDVELHYVSRGALKIKEAIEQFSVDVNNKVCLDVGLSTGGFSDYLLQNGAQKILGLDVGRDQLHPSLKANKNLVSFDKVNAKEPFSEDLLSSFFGDKERVFDIIVVDVSFISLSMVIPNLTDFLSPSSKLITLVKPQFELSRSDLNKKGVVKSTKKVDEVIEKMGGVFKENGLKIQGTHPSPIEGENGNKEILMLSSQS